MSDALKADSHCSIAKNEQVSMWLQSHMSCDDPGPWCRLVGQVLRKVERQLQAQLQHLLVALLTGPSNGSPLRANLAPLILQVHLAL